MEAAMVLGIPVHHLNNSLTSNNTSSSNSNSSSNSSNNSSPISPDLSRYLFQISGAGKVLSLESTNEN
jgi:hypothetical protein